MLLYLRALKSLRRQSGRRTRPVIPIIEPVLEAMNVGREGNREAKEEKISPKKHPYTVHTPKQIANIAASITQAECEPMVLAHKSLKLAAFVYCTLFPSKTKV
mmetsp:Transcript_9793/g.13753  ORF Transcript_9793/g.13753 Transcript_9793/m.13753 type:complete len:103 (-) Transcript_9793:429-737(-)